MSVSENFLTPVGRLVQGDCFEAQTKDLQTGQLLTVKTGPNAGQPTVKYFVAVAFAKTDPAFATFRQQAEGVARRAFPQLFPNGGACINPNFSWKIIDGDGVDQNGKSNATKEGFPGHWVVRFASSYPPRCFAAGKYQPHEQLTDPKSIPRGHYIRVAGKMSDNIPSNKPGLYMNLDMVEWNHIGDVIVSGPDASTVFGGGAATGGNRVMTAKAGATTYDQYIAAGWTEQQLIDGGYMTIQAPAAAASAAPPPPGATNAAPPPPSQTAVAPHTTILQGPQMTAKAGATSYAQYIAAGWTEQQLIDGGYMVAPAPAAGTAAPPPPNPNANGSAAPPPPSAGTAVARSGQDRMLPAAGATTYAAYIAGGWTEAQLVQNGFMSAT